MNSNADNKLGKFKGKNNYFSKVLNCFNLFGFDFIFSFKTFIQSFTLFGFVFHFIFKNFNFFFRFASSCPREPVEGFPRPAKTNLLKNAAKLGMWGVASAKAC